MASLIGQVEAFQPGVQDWEQYTERLEQYFVANGIADDAKKLAVFLTVVGAKTYALLSDLLAPAKPSTKSYTELKEVLKAHLQPKPVIIAERFQFHQRAQKAGEDVASYMAALRRLADKCSYGAHLEEALRDRFVCGLREATIQRKLLAIDGLTLKTAYETAYGNEAAYLRASQLQGSKTAVHVETAAVNAIENKRPAGRSNSACGRCGKTNHSSDSCYYRQQKCRACGKLGHIARMCRGKKTRPRPSQRTDLVERGSDTQGSSDLSDSDDLPMMSLTVLDEHQSIQVVKPATSRNGIMLDLTVDTKPLQMELDTGASVSIVSEKTWKTVLDAPALAVSPIKLKTYTGHQLKVLGQLLVQVQYGDQTRQLPLLVVSGNGPALFGRNWLGEIRLDWGIIKVVRSTLDDLLNEYAEVFGSGLGTLRGIQAKLELKPNARPRFHKPRSVPYAIKGAIEQDLERLVRIGVLDKVKYSDWAAPIVPVPKRDGGIRLCGDYKVTVNPELKVDQYPVPTTEDLFATLAGGQAFSKLDLSQAYQQVPLEPESRKYVTINTHRGLYQFNRLPFGVASAPAIFQEIMEKILQGIPGVVVYFDDILVTGKNEAEHLKSLTQVLDQLKHYGLRLKRSKCKFLAPSVDYLGYRIDREGLHAMQDKITAIVNAPEPTNVHELRAFLGLVNYYGRFIKQLSTLIYPLNQLLGKRVPWVWSKACQEAFEKLKARLASPDVLAHYDMNLPLRLDCDASGYGLGAVLSHTFSDGTERPIAYASRTLSAAEKNYAQIEKEGLALIFGIKKFHKYIYGRQFTLVTDHKPLMAILGSKKSLPTLAAARLQRWAIILLGYQYTLEFRHSIQHANADGFSRLPRGDPEGEDDMDAGTVAFNLHQIETLPVSGQQVRNATLKDPQLSKVLRYTREGWPSEVLPELQPYHQRRFELGMEAGCLFWGTRIVVPLKLRPQVLAELHSSHPGIVRMKGQARGHVWWPGLSADIEQTVHNCDACQGNRRQPPTVPLHPWPWATTPWERVHIDYAGPLFGYMYLVVVDSHSKWLEVVPVKSSTTEKTLEVLRSLFARYGLPRQLVSDNGPQFTSVEFEECMRNNGIRHLRSAPYHPATNGEAERFVQTFKRSLHASKNDDGTVPQKLARFLLTYRATPHATTGVPPAELFLKRQLRTRLDLLKPSVEGHVHDKQLEQKKYHDQHAHQRSFVVGQLVLAKNLRDGPKWLVGRILSKLGPVNYQVDVHGQIWKRHADQLMTYKGEQETREQVSDPEASLTSPPEEVIIPLSPPASDPVAEAGGTPPVVETPSEVLPPEVVETPAAPVVPTIPPSAPEINIPMTKVYPRRERSRPNRFEPTF